MGKVLLDLAVSLDGFIDGLDGADVGLYNWYAATFDPDAEIAQELVATMGAAAVIAAGDRCATVRGGADVARQALDLGLVDEVQLHLVPVVVGARTRLFTGPAAG